MRVKHRKHLLLNVRAPLKAVPKLHHSNSTLLSELSFTSWSSLSVLPNQACYRRSNSQFQISFPKVRRNPTRSRRRQHVHLIIIKLRQVQVSRAPGMTRILSRQPTVSMALQKILLYERRRGPQVDYLVEILKRTYQLARDPASLLPTNRMV